MITFYPGPSKVYPQVANYLQDAIKEGILSQNHRSSGFMDMLKYCIQLFKEKQNIPDDYYVCFTSSATECWEIVSQSLVENHSSHIYNGAFGEKWYHSSGRFVNKACASTFNFNNNFADENNINRFKEDELKSYYQNIFSQEITCITQNETSNGTQIIQNEINIIQEITGSNLIAIDVTSSLGGIELDWKLGDIWLASVQKCLGLPAGLGIMIYSPKALKRAEEIGERSHYNSLLFIHENFQKYQTHYTPNILGIYLLMRVMQQVADIQTISSKTKARSKDFYDFIETQTSLELLIENSEVRSETVIAVKGEIEEIANLKQKAKENNITLGNGYGEWKDTTFRIANFPAIEDWEFKKLKNILM